MRMMISERPLLGPHLDVDNVSFVLQQPIVNALERVVRQLFPTDKQKYWPHFFAVERFLRGRVAAVFPSSDGQLFPSPNAIKDFEAASIPNLVQLLESDTSFIPVHHDVVFVAAATPTRIKLKAPELTLSNRVVRNFSTQGLFLRVRLGDEDEALWSRGKQACMFGFGPM